MYWQGILPDTTIPVVGYQSLTSNTDGYNNTAFGQLSMYSNSSFKEHCCRSEALFMNTTGSDNASFGFQSMNSNTAGSGNTATGSASHGHLITQAATMQHLGTRYCIQEFIGLNNVAIGSGGFICKPLGDFKCSSRLYSFDQQCIRFSNVGVGASVLSETQPVLIIPGIGTGTLGSELIWQATIPQFGSYSLTFNALGQEKLAIGAGSLPSIHLATKM